MYGNSNVNYFSGWGTFVEQLTKRSIQDVYEIVE